MHWWCQTDDIYTIITVNGDLYMCTTALVLMAVTSTAMTVHGQRQAAKAQQAQAEYNAAVQENNAIIAEQNAQYEADRHDNNLRRILAKTRSEYGASGITRTGSALDVQLDTVSQSELDKLEILYGGSLTAEGARASAVSQRMAGAAAVADSKSKIGATLLAGTTQLVGIHKSTGGDMGVFNKKGRTRLGKEGWLG